MNFAKLFWHLVQDIGFAHDGRCRPTCCCNRTWCPAKGEWTLAFVVDFILSKMKGDIVCHCITSRMLDDIAANHGATLHRTGGRCKVGWLKRCTKLTQSSGVKALVALSILMCTIRRMASPLLPQSPIPCGIWQHLTQLVENMPQYQMCRKKLEIPSQEVANASCRFRFKGLIKKSVTLEPNRLLN